jgi:hypothetical protein
MISPECGPAGLQIIPCSAAFTVGNVLATPTKNTSIFAQNGLPATNKLAPQPHADAFTYRLPDNNSLNRRWRSK